VSRQPEAGRQLHLERLTWPAVREALDAGVTTAVVACGAVEQHGPALPLFMDAENGSRLAEEVARRLGGALVAPTIRIGCSDHHLGFPGTLSLRRETFEAVCTDYVTSLARHGFRRILFLPTHGGNFVPLDNMLPRLREAAGDAVRVEAFTELGALVELWREVVEAEAGMGERVGGHADIAEGSIMLALHPELVREEAAAAGFMGGFTAEMREKMYREGIGAVTANGILGDARGMSAELGERLIEATAEMVAEHFRSGAAAA
jgi:creatinine amidohydrolase